MKFLKPFKKASQQYVSQNYSQTHRAIDWFKKYSEPLVAPEDGTITRILGNTYTPNDTYPLARGYVVEITGKSGFRHEYWHIMPYLPVSVGEVVVRGQIVGYMGNSGNVLSGNTYVPLEDRIKPPYLGTHLHQNLIRNGEYLNPILEMDLTEEPSYTIFDQLIAISKTLKNISKVLK